MQTVAIDPRFEGAWNVLGNHLQKAKDVSKNVEGLNVFHMYHIASKTNPGSFEINVDHYFYPKNSEIWEKTSKLQGFEEASKNYNSATNMIVALWIPKLANAPKDVVGSIRLIDL